MTRFGTIVLACAALIVSVARAQTSSYVPVARLEAPEPQARDAFGTEIAADGAWAVATESVTVDRATVHLVHLHDGTAEVVQTLTDPETTTASDYGAAVAISGDTLAVSNPTYACGTVVDCGAVYLYVLRDGRWEFDARVNSPVPTRRDEFGRTLALQNDTLVVQSAGKRAGMIEAGVLDIFEREDGVFRHRQALQPAGIIRRARFGESLSLSGDTILAGAYSDRVDDVATGGAYVMKRGEGGWVFDARLVDTTRTRLGDMVAIHGDLRLVSDPFDEDLGYPGEGSFRMFRRVDGEVRQLPKLIDPSPGPQNLFGTGVAVEGDRLWIGSRETTPDNYDFGAVEVFRVEGDRVTWLEVLRPPTPVADDRFGSGIAVSGRYVLVSASNDSTRADRAGVVHVYYDLRAEDGGACSGNAGCMSGHCVDGVCCASACDTSGGCMACRAALTGGSDGSCGPVLAGMACGSTSTESCSLPDTCDGAGLCVDNHLADGTACEDGLFCRTGDVCQAGECLAGSSACPEDLACVEAQRACMSVCGDGVIQRGEACDDGVENSDTVANACRTTCKLAVCGDGVIDAGEGCDEGAANADAGACRTDCSPAGCGDGVVDEGEQCDTGSRNDDTRADSCRSTCVLPACGDGVVDQGETCDQGAANSDVQPDQCRNDCRPARCGDGVVDQGEACDEGAATTTCSATCTVPGCTGSACDDAGMPEPDAGMPEHDAGVTPEPEPKKPGGCSVASGTSPGLLAPLAWVFALLCVRRRRRARTGFTPSSR